MSEPVACLAIRDWLRQGRRLGVHKAPLSAFLRLTSIRKLNIDEQLCAQRDQTAVRRPFTWIRYDKTRKWPFKTKRTCANISAFPTRNSLQRIRLYSNRCSTIISKASPKQSYINIYQLNIKCKQRKRSRVDRLPVAMFEAK